MIVFNSENISKDKFNNVTEFVHDSYFENFEYDINKEYIYIKLANKIDKKFIFIKFEKVRFLFGYSTHRWGVNNQISCLVMQDCIDAGEETDIKIECNTPDDHLLFVFEMFSGNPIWIMCKNVFIDECDIDDISEKNIR